MARKTVTITVCDIEGCETQLDTTYETPCLICGAAVCRDHRASLERYGFFGFTTRHLGYICLPCIEVKLGITPKENA